MISIVWHFFNKSGVYTLRPYGQQERSWKEARGKVHSRGQRPKFSAARATSDRQFLPPPFPRPSSHQFFRCTALPWSHKAVAARKLSCSGPKQAQDGTVAATWRLPPLAPPRRCGPAERFASLFLASHTQPRVESHVLRAKAAKRRLRAAQHDKVPPRHGQPAPPLSPRPPRGANAPFFLRQSTRTGHGYRMNRVESCGTA